MEKKSPTKCRRRHALKPWLVLLVGILCLLFCAKREGGIQERTNPVDIHGDSNTVNIPPLLSVHVPSFGGKATWADFDFQDSTGGIAMTFSGFDSNGVEDTLRFTLFLGKSPAALSEVYSSGLDSFYVASHLAFATRYYFRCVVHDRRDSTVDTGSFLTAGTFPPPSPVGLNATDDFGAIPLKWNRVASADGYRIYRSYNQSGWFTEIATVYDTSFHDSVPDYYQVYYRVASFNNSGENRSTEFATGRKIFTSSNPFFITASRNDSTVGPNLIKITLNNNYGGNQATYDCHLFRSNAVSGQYLDIQGMQVSTSGTPGFFIDTVTNTAIYFYKVAVFDQEGRGSALSECDSGYTRRLNSTYLSPSFDTYGLYIQLDWGAVPRASGYYIYRSISAHTSLDTTYRLIDSTGSISYKDSVPSDKQIYYYIIVAYNGTGAGSQSTMQSGKRLSPPAGFAVNKEYTTTKYISLTWTQYYDGRSYYLYRSADRQSYVRIGATTSTYFQDTVKDYSVYYYAITSVKTTNLSESAKSLPDSGRLKPTTPDSLTAKQALNKILVSWNQSDGALGYHVYRYDNFGYAWHAIDTTSDTVFADSVSNDSIIHQYRVAAYNESGEGTQSASIYQKRLSPPGAPNSFTVTDGPAGIDLSWVPDRSDYASIEKGFFMYRTTDSTRIGYSVIDTVSDTVFTDTVIDAKIYFYKVAAYNDAGVGKFATSYTAISGQRTKPTEPDSLKASQGETANAIRVWWQRSAGADSFSVYRFTSCSPVDSFKLRTITADTAYTDAVTDDSMYSYRVVAINIIGSSSLLLGQNCIQGFRKPSSAPLAPVLSDISPNTFFNISWSPPDSGARITGYHLYRALNDSVSGFSCIDTLDRTSYLDSNAPLTYPPNAYYFMVRAYNTVGESVDSNVKRAVH